MRGRRALLTALPALLAGCSVFPDRPNVPVRRYILDPRRPSRQAPRAGAPVLLVRRVRGVPGLQELGLRRARVDGSFEVLFYEEWIAPPADLAEAALRSWLQASGLFAAVVAPGSRLDAPLVLELQLTALEAVPPAGEARAALAGVLLREERLSARVIAPFEVTGTAPLPPDALAPAEARAMEAALAEAFARLEAVLAPLVRQGARAMSS
jgi:cholesterol transport system auxiliary component